MTNLKQINSKNFNEIFTITERNKVVNSYKNTINLFEEKMNMNYFSSPQNYSPYKIFCGEIPFEIPLMEDMSRVNICSLDYISTLNEKHIILDYACGTGDFVYYANKFFKTYGFDRWKQIPKEATLYHLNDLNINETHIIDYEEIKNIKPTIINVSGYWLEDIELYNLDSVKYILSDPLYNSGRVKNEGVYFYNGNNWNNVPENFNFKKILSYPVMDVYKKI